MGVRFSEKDREEIKRLFNAGMRQQEIAEMYGTTKNTISKICSDPNYGKRPEVAARVTIEKINAFKAQGMTYKQIANELHTTEQCVKNTVYRSKLPKPQKAIPPPRSIKPLSETLASIGPALSESNRGRAAAATAHVMECMDIGRTVDNENPDSLFNGLKAYVQLCLERDFPMTISNACLALGVARKTLLAWKQGQAHTDNPEFQKLAESVYTIIQGGIEATMANGVLNPVLGIWWEKAHFDMKEADHVQEVRGNPLGEAKSAEQIAAQYSELDLPD